MEKWIRRMGVLLPVLIFHVWMYSVHKWTMHGNPIFDVTINIDFITLLVLSVILLVYIIEHWNKD